ncbi:solute carrier family 22 member 15-like [Bolinopsis microptera]|uniref:solute carrier family 22 member 15-like n=1 Tax=Bolinopsis microptera TaxID=2820187 RepID=UPI0030791280
MIPITLGEALDKTNNHGRYQILLFVLCSLFTAQEVFHICLDIFTAKPLSWRWRNEDTEIERFSYPPCQASRPWVYTQNSTVSIRSEFDLHCSPIKLSLIPASFFAGRVCGLLLFWSVSTQFGRRWPVICSIWANSIVSWLLSCSVSYEVYVILRILDGFTMEGYVTISYVLLIECINEKKRQIFATQFRSLQGLGFIILSAVAYLSSSWKMTSLIMGLLITIHGALASVFIPESPRWLLAQGRNGDIVTLIHKVSTCNNRRIKDQFYIIENKKITPRESLMAEKELFLTTLSLVIVWGLLHVAEYILYFNILFLPGNAYLNLLLLGVCDIPGRALPIVLMDHLGRKRTLFLWNLLAGLFLLVCCVDNKIVRSLSYFIAKLVMSGNIVLIKVYTNDLSPRSDYSALYAYCELMSRLVGCGVPFLLCLNYQYPSYWHMYAVAGCSVLLSTIFILPLPETRGRAKPENVNQFISLFYGSRFRPVNQGYSNGRVTTPHINAQLTMNAGKAVDDHVYPMSKKLMESIPQASTSRTWTERVVPRFPRNNMDQRNHGTQEFKLSLLSNTDVRNHETQQEFELNLLSNTDVRNLSLHDPDIYKLKKHSPNLESGVKARELVRPKSLNIQRRNNRPVLSRNPSYASSLNDTNTIMSATPDTSFDLAASENSNLLTPNNADFQINEDLLKRNSLFTFTPKSSVRKDFFSLSRV